MFSPPSPVQSIASIGLQLHNYLCSKMKSAGSKEQVLDGKRGKIKSEDDEKRRILIPMIHTGTIFGIGLKIKEIQICLFPPHFHISLKETSLWKLNNKISSPKEACDALCLFLSSSRTNPESHLKYGNVMMIPTTISNNRNKCNVLMKLGHGGKVYKHVEFQYNLTITISQEFVLQIKHEKSIQYALAFVDSSYEETTLKFYGDIKRICNDGNLLRGLNSTKRAICSFQGCESFFFSSKIKRILEFLNWFSRLKIWFRASSSCSTIAKCGDDEENQVLPLSPPPLVLSESIGAAKPYLWQFIDSCFFPYVIVLVCVMISQGVSESWSTRSGPSRMEEGHLSLDRGG
uniref:Uncharacterized protein n=1 Tax=Cucumis melo TaxID=3656 RepID=A0A9I9EHB9_CUCME